MFFWAPPAQARVGLCAVTYLRPLARAWYGRLPPPAATIPGALGRTIALAAVVLTLPDPFISSILLNMAKEQAKPKPKPQEPNNSKRLIKLLLYALGGIALMFFLLILFAAFFEDKVGRIVINTLQNQLKTSLKVEKAELSLVWGFPNATVTLKNVELKDSTNQTDLLKVGQLSLKCGILGMITGEYRFHSIQVSDGSLFIWHGKKGQANYNIFKSEEETQADTSSSAMDLAIDKANFKNIQFRYLDEQLRQDIKFDLQKGFFAGAFGEKRYTLDSYADLFCHYIELDGNKYLNQKEISYNTLIEMDHEQQEYRFDRVQLSLEENRFGVEGLLRSLARGGMFWDLRFTGESIQLGSVIKLLPSSLKKQLGEFESNAFIEAKAAIKGPYTEKEIPEVELQMNLKKGRVTHPKMTAPIKDLRFQLLFSNKNKNQTPILELRDLHAYLDGNPIEMDLEIKGIEKPKLDFRFGGIFTLRSMHGLLGEAVTEGKGSFELEDLRLKGDYEDFINPKRIHKVEASGLLSFNGVELVSNDEPLQIKSGAVILQGNLIRIQDLVFQANKNNSNHLAINGEIENFLPFILGTGELKTRTPMILGLDISSKSLHVDDLLRLFPSSPSQPPSKKQEPSADTSEQASFHIKEIEHYVRGQIRLACDKGQYDKLLLQNFKGQIEFTPQHILFKNWALEAMNGRAELNAKVHLYDEPYLLAFVDFKSIDIQQLFSQLNNFGQDYLTDKQLRGKLTSLVKIDAYWDKKGNFLSKDLFVLADVLLRDGELIGLSMLESFSTFVKVKDLRHIKFTELRNQFRIQDATLHIPAMFIRSNALNLTMAGTHSFNQEVDYKFKINAGQVLINRLRQHDPDLEPLKAREKGLFNVYARMTGNLGTGKYQVKMGKKHTKKALEAELKKELPAIANILKVEFDKSGLNGESRLSELEEPKEWDDIPDFQEDFDDSKQKKEYVDWD
jgi:hypothetical protein